MKLSSLTTMSIALGLLVSMANGRADDGTTTGSKTAPIASTAQPTTPAAMAPPPHIVGVLPVKTSSATSVQHEPGAATSSSARSPEATKTATDAAAQAKRDQEEATRVAQEQLQQAQQMADEAMAREAAADLSGSDGSETPTPEQIQAQKTYRHYSMNTIVSESNDLNPPPSTTHHSMYNFF